VNVFLTYLFIFRKRIVPLTLFLLSKIGMGRGSNIVLTLTFDRPIYSCFPDPEYL